MGAMELAEPIAPVARGGEGRDVVRMTTTPHSSTLNPFEGAASGLTPVPDQGPVVVAGDESMVVVPPSPVLGGLGDSMRALCSCIGAPSQTVPAHSITPPLMGLKASMHASVPMPTPQWQQQVRLANTFLLSPSPCPRKHSDHHSLSSW
jgi:hypothetical protein